MGRTRLGPLLYKTIPPVFVLHISGLPQTSSPHSLTTLTMASPSSSQGITTRPILIQSGPISVSVAHLPHVRGKVRGAAWRMGAGLLSSTLRSYACRHDGGERPWILECEAAREEQPQDPSLCGARRLRNDISHIFLT